MASVPASYTSTGSFSLSLRVIIWRQSITLPNGIPDIELVASLNVLLYLDRIEGTVTAVA
jgi:hypothetical protein